jgi:hypothetical protein
MISFAEWLEHARVTDDPEGDLVTDMRTERELPNFTSFESMHSYVRFKSNGDRAVLAAVPGVWRRYEAWCRRPQI